MIIKNIGILLIIFLICGLIAIICKLYVDSEKKIEEISVMSEKHLVLYRLMNEWVRKKQDGLSVSEYLLREGYVNIAIYGMNYVGVTLARELEGSEIQVSYGIDKNADYIYSDIELVKPTDLVNSVDVIIVTPIFYFLQIKEELSSKVDCPIISLADVLNEM